MTQLIVPPVARVGNVWGWVTALLPVVSFLVDSVRFLLMGLWSHQQLQWMAEGFAAAGTNPSQTANVPSLPELVASTMPLLIGALVFTALGLGLYGFGVLAAYFDYQRLGALGYAKRFHWAWNFLSPTYPIGRSILMHRQAGAGRAPLWIAASATAATIIVVILWSFWWMTEFLNTLSTFPFPTLAWHG